RAAAAAAADRPGAEAQPDRPLVRRDAPGRGRGAGPARRHRASRRCRAFAPAAGRRPQARRRPALRQPGAGAAHAPAAADHSGGHRLQLAEGSAFATAGHDEPHAAGAGRAAHGRVAGAAHAAAAAGAGAGDRLYDHGPVRADDFADPERLGRVDGKTITTMTQPTPQLEYATPPCGGRSPEALWWWGLIRRLMWCLLGMILLSILIFVFALGSRLLLNWALPIATLLV